MGPEVMKVLTNITMSSPICIRFRLRMRSEIAHGSYGSHAIPAYYNYSCSYRYQCVLSTLHGQKTQFNQILSYLKGVSPVLDDFDLVQMVTRPEVMIYSQAFDVSAVSKYSLTVASKYGY